MADYSSFLINMLQISEPLVFTGSGSVNMQDQGVLYLNKGTGAATAVTLPRYGKIGMFAFVKDAKGDAATNNITLSPDGTTNNTTIDGASTLVINSNYGAVLLGHNGTEWSVLQSWPNTNVVAGASGSAGEVDIYPATGSKGKTSLTASNNSGNTTTNINTAAQAGARTYTIPDAGGNADFLLAGETQGANGLFATSVGLTHFRNADGSAVAASASSGKFGYSISLGTSIFLIGEAAQSNTKTDDAIAEFMLPPWYIAGQNITVSVYAKLTGTGTAGTKTAQILAYRCGTDGTMGSDIGPGSASAITAAGATITFTITGTTLNPGDKIIFKLETVLQETGGSATITAEVGSVRVS